MALTTIHLIRDETTAGPWQYGELFLGTDLICSTAEDKDELLAPGNYELTLDVFPRFNVVWPRVVGPGGAWMVSALPPRFDGPLNIEVGVKRVTPTPTAALAGQDIAMSRVLEILTYALDTPKEGRVILRRFPREARHKAGASRFRTRRPARVRLKILAL